MRKSAVIFVLSIFVPTVVLGVLALQSARQQRVLLQNQQAQLWQQNADSLATQIDLAVRIEQENFLKAVDALTARPRFSISDLDDWTWYHSGVTFIIDERGEILTDKKIEHEFLQDNRAFLTGRATANIYRVEPTALREVQQNLAQRQQSNVASNSAMRFDGNVAESSPRGEEVAALKFDKKSAPPAPKARTKVSRGKDAEMEVAKVKEEAPPATQASESEAVSDADSNDALIASEEKDESSIKRKVAPTRSTRARAEVVESPAEVTESDVSPTRSRFGELLRGKENGIIARYVDERLEVLFWTRQEKFPGAIFGVRLLTDDLREVITQPVQDFAMSDPNMFVVVLDNLVQPFTVPQVKRDWTKPFVAANIGDVLPHWKIGVYMFNPQSLAQSARVTSLTLMAVVGLALAAVALGGWLVARDTQRQLALARKKTDFVSNVSHELKTPLTSIRMFAELLQQNRVQEPGKVAHYLQIIVAEAERLTRLINNVLDFSRSEKKKKVYRFERLDLHEVIRHVWEGTEVHLREQGFTTAWQAQEGPYTVQGDADALAQVLVNLLSNAEKYSPTQKDVTLLTHTTDDGKLLVSVMDRGLGVPAGEERKIFEQFYRCHDSMADGIGGTGLGLTLARRIAQAHGGDIAYESRTGGGSIFTLHLPLLKT